MWLSPMIPFAPLAAALPFSRPGTQAVTAVPSAEAAAALARITAPTHGARVKTPLAPLVPTLRQIHEAGLELGPPPIVCARFALYRALEPRERDSFNTLWDLANGEAAQWNRSNWMGEREFLDPNQPYWFARSLAAHLDIADPVTRLHHDLKRELVAARLNGIPRDVADTTWAELLALEDRLREGAKGRDLEARRIFRELDRSLVVLETGNPASLDFIAERLKNRWNQTTESSLHLAAVVQETARSLASLPPQAAIEGPLVSVAFRRGFGSQTLKRAAGIQGPFRLIVTLEGSAEIVIPVPLDQPPFVEVIPAQSRPIVAGFLEACRQGRRRDPDNFTALVASLRYLATGDAESWPTLLDAIGRWNQSKSPEDSTRITFAAKRAAGLARRHRAKGIIVDGDPFGFFYRGYGQNTAATRLAQRIVSGRVTAIHFRKGEDYELELTPPLRRSQPTSLPFTRDDIASLPNAANRWGEGDRPKSLAQAPRHLARVQERIERLFAEVEGGLGISATEMMRRSGPDKNYFSYRSGAQPLPTRCLADSFLEPLGFTLEQRARMRELQILRRLAAWLELVGAAGPYLRPGLLLRHLRLAAETRRSQEVADTLKARLKLRHHIHHYETGWLRFRDARELVSLAEIYGIPEPERPVFAATMLEGYDGVDRKLAPLIATTEVETFPNADFTLPFRNWDRHRLQDEVRRLSREIREATGLSRPALARRLGLPSAHSLTSAEGHGFLEPRLLTRYRRLRHPRMIAMLDRLRLIRAALELHYNPVPDNAALGEVGKLLRFARVLIPGLTHTGLWRRLKARVEAHGSPVHLSFYESGLLPMPDNLLVTYAQLLVDEGALVPEEGERFAKKIRSFYRAAGVEFREKGHVA